MAVCRLCSQILRQRPARALASGAWSASAAQKRSVLTVMAPPLIASHKPSAHARCRNARRAGQAAISLRPTAADRAARVVRPRAWPSDGIVSNRRWCSSPTAGLVAAEGSGSDEAAVIKHRSDGSRPPLADARSTSPPPICRITSTGASRPLVGADAERTKQIAKLPAVASTDAAKQAVFQWQCV